MEKSLEAGDPAPSPSGRNTPAWNPDVRHAPEPVWPRIGARALQFDDTATSLVEHLDAGVLVADRSDRVHLANPRFCEPMGLEPSQVVGAPVREMAARAAGHLRDPGALLESVDAALRDGASRPGDDIETLDGRLLSFSYTPVGEHRVAHLWQCRDVTEARRREQYLHALAQTDELTGLPNRRHVLDELGRELARFHRTGRPASVLMLDIDRFKQINDGHGHAAGDTVLRELAAVISRTCRAADTAARLGGDEFLLVLPETGPDGCREIAERLGRRVRRAGGALGPVACSVSIGATTMSTVDHRVDAVLARADRALYSVKQGGRNGIACVPPPRS